MNWDSGRQDATYYKKNLFSRILSRFNRDCYLIKIPAGTSIPPHKDSCVVEKQHIRTLIQISFSPKSGGNVYVSNNGSVTMFAPRFLKLIKFDASKLTHWTDSTSRDLYYISFGRLKEIS